MKYDPNKALYYFDETEEVYKEVSVFAVEGKSYDHLYQFNTLSGEYVEIDDKGLFYEILAAIKKFDKKKEEEATEDNINHPKHYTGCGIECIEAMQLMFTPQTVCGFCVCNAIKYLWRYKDKNGIEDIDKAWWYLNKATEINKNAGGTAFDNNMLFRVNKLYETVLARAERENNK